MQKDKLLIIFAKAPVPGQVKTRLTPDYSHFQASIIHQQLLEHTVSNLHHMKGVDVELHCAPDQEHKFFKYLKHQYQIKLAVQSEGDLGQKMSAAMHNALTNYNKVALIGSDAPAISRSYIYKAFDALDVNSAVIGPAEDGGYVLVALSKSHSEMFDQIEWGTEKVLQQTIDTLKPAFPILLDTLWDLDRTEDVARFNLILNNQ